MNDNGDLGKQLEVLEPNFRLLSGNTDGHRGFSYGYMVFLVAVGTLLVGGVASMHLSEHNPELRAYLLPGCVFAVVSIVAAGFLFKSTVKETLCHPIALHENGFAYKKTRLLYRDIANVKFGEGQTQAMSQAGDTLKMLSPIGKLRLAQERLARMEHNRRAMTIYIVTYAGQLIELESALGNFPEEDIAKLVGRIVPAEGSESSDSAEIKESELVNC